MSQKSIQNTRQYVIYNSVLYKLHSHTPGAKIYCYISTLLVFLQVLYKG